jgi:hypothetical protein
MYLQKLSWDNAARRCNSTREFFTLSCTPTGEECTQAGGNMSDMLIECRALVNQLIRIHGEPPQEAEFVLLINDHEFGRYYEVGIFFSFNEDSEAQDEDTPSEIYARKCESGIPDMWDKIALAEMKEAGHSRFIPKAPARVVKHQGKVINIKSETA